LQNINGGFSMVALDPMTEEAFLEWFEHFCIYYGQEHAKTGRWLVDEAPRRAREEITNVLHGGLNTNDNYLCTINDPELGQSVGALWFAVIEQHGKRFAVIYHIEIHEDFRHRGYATQTFLEIEKRARELGASRIKLHVFGHNYGARKLYEKLGYVTTNIDVMKMLVTLD
jgi:ribosomal protein S18 acetylase RimI-like enzyme